MPDVPAVAEAVPGFDATPTIFLVAPAGTPAARTAAYSAALKAVLAKKEVLQVLETQGAIPDPGTPAELGLYIAREEERWAGVIKRANIKLD